MNRQLVFVHGRSQEKKDAVQLKAQWIDAWSEGLWKSGLKLPIDESQIRFPYFGQTLYDLVTGVPTGKTAEVIVRGAEGNPEEMEFIREVVEEVRREKGITDAQVEAVAEREVLERGGPLNWGWVRGILSAVDQYLPGASGASIALATKDVYQYMRNQGIRDLIETGVRDAMTPEVPTVVVSHSLGTVVAYNLLRRDGPTLKWNMPLFVTVGSPLAVTAIKKMLRPIGFPTCAKEWYNAMDDRDIVALYPLDSRRFDVDPAIENNTKIDNQTDNRHGIAGYLNDKDVAKRMYDALTA